MRWMTWRAASGGPQGKEAEVIAMREEVESQAGAHTPSPHCLLTVRTRGLHLSTFRLNLSAFYGIGVHLGAVQGVLGGVRGY